MKSTVDPTSSSSSSSTPNFGEATLKNCDREPIHIPGSIQPHGLLFVLKEPDLTILQISANTKELLSISPDKALQLNLREILTKESMAFFSVENLQLSSFIRLNPMKITTRIGGQHLKWSGVLHRSQKLLVLELEKTHESDHPQDLRFATLAAQSLSRFQNLIDAPEIFETLSGEVKQLTGFDRVMTYRFHEEGDGEVIAEVKETQLEPWLGLHYPASDVPQQARTLYEKNTLRLIPDVSYQPSPLLSNENGLFKTPLDLTYSLLRSVSPTHCEYLSNMGVKASLAISLLKNGKLWGMIICHHYKGKKWISHEVRSQCTLLGQMISWRLSERIQIEENSLPLTAKIAENQLLSSLTVEAHFPHALLKEESSLMNLTQAGGAVAFYENEIYLIGKTPDLEQVKGLLGWLQDRLNDQPVFQTNCLSKYYPKAELFKDVASGILAISFSKTTLETLIWFRPEILQVVRWGGNPNLPSHPNEPEQTPPSLSPRTSFAVWKETVQLHSHPWKPWQIESALTLKTVVLGLILKKASDTRRLNEELRKALRSRDDFLSTASHELKNPLTALHLQVELLLKLSRTNPGDLPRNKIVPKLELTLQQVKRINQLIDNLLDVSRIRERKLKLKVEELNLSRIATQAAELFQPEFAVAGRTLNLTVKPDVTGHWDSIRLNQVITNLLSNALKYGGSKPVEMKVWSQNESAFLAVKDQGIGIEDDNISRIFGRFERATSNPNYKGLGLGLWISKQIVEAFRGKISVQTSLGQGSEFTLELPTNPSYFEWNLD